MDLFTGLLALLGITSAVMSVVQAIETYTLWKVKNEIPTRIKQGVSDMLKDPEQMKAIMASLPLDDLMQGLWDCFRTYVEKFLQGQAGKYEAARKDMGSALEADLNPLVDLIPDGKFKEKLKKHPEWVGIGMQLLGPMIQKMVAAQTGGNPYGR